MQFSDRRGADWEFKLSGLGKKGPGGYALEQIGSFLEKFNLGQGDAVGICHGQRVGVDQLGQRQVFCQCLMLDFNTPEITAAAEAVDEPAALQIQEPKQPPQPAADSVMPKPKATLAPAVAGAAVSALKPKPAAAAAAAAEAPHVEPQPTASAKPGRAKPSASAKHAAAADTGPAKPAPALEAPAGRGGAGGSPKAPQPKLSEGGPAAAAERKVPGKRPGSGAACNRRAHCSKPKGHSGFCTGPVEPTEARTVERILNGTHKQCHRGPGCTKPDGHPGFCSGPNAGGGRPGKRQKVEGVMSDLLTAGKAMTPTLASCYKLGIGIRHCLKIWI